MGTTVVYVDVLLVVNYIINLLLLLCTAKLTGVLPKRRKIVAAALFGCLCSLTIFLPFLGFLGETASKLLVSAILVRIGMPFHGLRTFLWHWFVFFAVSFCFAGAMLGVWMLAAPEWMMYYNGVVYFNISTVSLILTTVAAYVLLSVMNRFGKVGRLEGSLCRMQIFLGGRMCALTGLVDTGNGLFEPFSGAPVVVCRLDAAAALFSPETLRALKNGSWTELDELRATFRIVPYSGVDGSGVLPAFAPDKLIVQDDKGERHIAYVYVALSVQQIGNSRYSAILNPELISVKIKSGGVKQ